MYSMLLDFSYSWLVVSIDSYIVRFKKSFQVYARF